MIRRLTKSALSSSSAASDVYKRQALLNLDTKTGVSIQKMQLKLDTGPVILDQEIPIDAEDDFLTLKKKLSFEAASLAKKWWDLAPNFPNGKVQDESKVSYAGIIKKEDGKLTSIDSTKTAMGKIKAYVEWPGAFVTIEQKNFKITKAQISTIRIPNGTLSSQNKRLLLGFQDGSLEVIEIQPESKPKLSAASFLNGYQQYLGKVFS